MACLSIALVGNPNCGKTALFNLLTGSRQKVANYAGVTVECKKGEIALDRSAQTVTLLDLPGTYSLKAHSPDERITLDAIMGHRKETPTPDLVLVVVDATNLRMNLRLVLELKALNRPMIVALNMMDAARKQGLVIDLSRLSSALGCPVVETVAVARDGHLALLSVLHTWMQDRISDAAYEPPAPVETIELPDSADLQHQVRDLLNVAIIQPPARSRLQHRLDGVLLHPFWGLVILAAVLFVIFQAVFSWASVPTTAIQGAIGWLGDWLTTHMADGYLRSLLVNGILSGTGTVLAYLPQILILFFFILALEDSGYLPRAAFLLDRLMGSVGLSGRAFIPMLSSFACAIPGVMATRSIPNRRDRLLTIMLAPLMTCSARLPVYALFIGAFVPDRSILYGVNLQGVVLFVLYVAGVVSAMLLAWVVKWIWFKSNYQPLMLELPPYRRPMARSVLLGLKDRALLFLKRVTGVILAITVVLWALSNFPGAPAGATQPDIYYSFAGMIGRMLEWIFSPIGFNWQISIALVPGMAAREVAVGALGTVYALSSTEGGNVAQALMPLLAKSWSLATALSLLSWYVFAPQCLSTLVVVAKEAGHRKYAWYMAAYMFTLAYVSSFIVYHVTLWCT